MQDEGAKVQFLPIINGLQKMALYETKARWLNLSKIIYQSTRVACLDDACLNATADQVEYSQRQIKELLSMINEGNRSQSGHRHSSGLSRTVSAFGIVGFVRFLEGYYMVLVTKRRKVAVIGLHTIYKVEDTTMIYIPNDSVRKHKDDETKYVRLFQNIDLSSNFYFSYSYDLTHSLQYNLSPPKDIPIEVLKNYRTPKAKGSVERSENYLNLSANQKDTEDESDEKICLKNDYNPRSPKKDDGSNYNEKLHESSDASNNILFGIRNKPNKRFVWNSYLLKPVEEIIHPAWILPITHGFVAQDNISVYGRSFFLTLIARRSCCYAGTRFLKRGANFEGDVANEVETEQLVYDAHVTSLHHGRFTSFVQIRGSIPSHWSQDVSKMVPKPPITFDVMDPYGETAGKHFNQLLRRFGSPIIVLNLVKRRERRAHESILNTEYSRLIGQLNITLPPEHPIQYVAIDMARINKSKDENVMTRLSDIAYRAVKKTGFFQSESPYYSHHLNPNTHYRHLEKNSAKGDENFGTKKHITLGEHRGRLQTGVVRVNCVDCLDRTNTAQFVLGKCALAFQLYALGVLDSPSLEFDSDSVRMLEEMYEDHGDTLALQYGGSQLVHRIKTYRRTAPWTSQGNDIMQTLSRYYSNTFSDTEKQNAINLFLGIYVPHMASVPIWEMMSDYLLHHSLTRGVRPCHYSSTSQWWDADWWDADVMESLPLPVEESRKSVALLVPVSKHEPKVDLFLDHHRPSEFCILSELYTYHMSHSVRDYMPNFTTDDSPFSVRRRPGKRQEELSRNQGISTQKNPVMSGKASTESTASSGASSTESEASDEDQLSVVSQDSDEETSNSQQSNGLSLVSFFPPMTETYGDHLHTIERTDLALYKRYVQIGQATNGMPTQSNIMSESNSKQASASFMLVGRPFSFTQDSSVETEPPSVPRRSRDIYNNFVAMATKGPQPPPHRDVLLYQKFASFI
ncbi:unnamed protein product, partial [Meganyctiphanes norvegica]